MTVLRIALVAALLCPGWLAAQDIDLDVDTSRDGLRDILENASLVLSIEDEDEDPAAQDYVAAARADYRRLLTALYADGYYSGVISIRINGREAAGIAPLAAPRTIDTITIDIDPGPRFRFGNINIGPQAPDTILPDEFSPGETARAEVISDASGDAINAWRENGHAKPDIADETIIARHPDRRLDVDIVIAPGPRVTFGPIAVTGEEDVRASAIRRIGGIPRNEVFSPDELSDAARRLRATGAFDSVSIIEGDTILPGNELPIEIAVVEAPKRRIGFGIELSTVDGLAVSSFWLHRNLFGGAERFRIEGEISGIGGSTGGVDYLLGASLKIPAIYGPRTDLVTSFQIKREDEPDYFLDKISFESIATRELTEDLTVSTGIGFLAAREETAFGSRDYALFTLPLGATLDRRDSETNAQNGYYIDISATPFLSIDGADNGARLYGDLRGYRSFGEDDRFTLAARFQLGSVVGPDPEDTPALYQFYSGGGGTVRGQAYKSLGVDINGDTIGGQSFAGAQIEGRFEVRENISIVGFYDYGYVGAGAVPLEDGDDHSGVGLGLRYDTGIGPIRLDIGTPADGDDAFERVEVYIGIGQAF